jgi:hypothetical protein
MRNNEWFIHFCITMSVGGDDFSIFFKPDV